MKARIPDPDSWVARDGSGLGSCFHQAFTRWWHLQNGDAGAYMWRIAVGVVREGLGTSNHVHAWLERGEHVVSATSGKIYERGEFYQLVDIDARSVRLINPHRILRARKYVIDREAVKDLLAAWGGRYRIHENGGVVLE